MKVYAEHEKIAYQAWFWVLNYKIRLWNMAPNTEHGNEAKLLNHIWLENYCPKLVNYNFFIAKKLIDGSWLNTTRFHMVKGRSRNPI